MSAAGLREHLADRTLLEVAEQIRLRQVSSLELTDAALSRLAALEPSLNAFVTVLTDQARADAANADAEIAAGAYRGPLHGIPLSLKDLFDTAGIRTTAGSRILADNVPDEDATIVSRLRAAGAVITGKTNMLEFAYAAVHPDYGPTSNPWDLKRSTSGSSSGSAAAVAAGIGYGSIGSDTGGSIRLPAAYCGIVGLKPTYGRVSRHGAVPVSWSCDHVGPMTRSVADAAALLGVIAGEDPRDSTTGRVPVPDYLAGLRADLAGVRVGVADAYLRQHVEPSVQRLVQAALADLERLGATIVEIALPPPSEAVPALLGILSPEATAFHLPWLRTCPEAYSQAVREHLELGAITSAVTYIEAQRERRRITDAMAAAMQAVDVIAMPTAPTAATLQDDDLVSSDDADPALLAALINFTGPFDLTGFPAVSLPCGFMESGLPVGLQLVARPYDEGRLLAAAHAYEQAHDWSNRAPTATAELIERSE
jgi:aspartyl-tRNA(Asn)/glutamyl-tRNA(Gln) amidotransferase subunit A